VRSSSRAFGWTTRMSRSAGSNSTTRRSLT
jgi:hypothetical protein